MRVLYGVLLAALGLACGENLASAATVTFDLTSSTLQSYGATTGYSQTKSGLTLNILGFKYDLAGNPILTSFYTLGQYTGGIGVNSEGSTSTSATSNRFNINGDAREGVAISFGGVNLSLASLTFSYVNKMDDAKVQTYTGTAFTSKFDGKIDTSTAGRGQAGSVSILNFSGVTASQFFLSTVYGTSSEVDEYALKEIKVVTTDPIRSTSVPLPTSAVGGLALIGGTLMTRWRRRRM